MNANELQSLAKKDKQLSCIFAGIFASDQLPNIIKKKPCAFIINTDPINKPGEHWVAIYFDTDGHGDYFDSYGLEPFVIDIQNFLIRNSNKQNFNKKRLQSSDSFVCGLYCLYFLYFRSRNIKMSKLLDAFHSYNFGLNDAKVYNFFYKTFNHMHKVCCSNNKVQSCLCLNQKECNK